MTVHIIDNPVPPTSTGHGLTIGSGDTVVITETGNLAAIGQGSRGIDGWSVGSHDPFAIGTTLVIQGRVSSASSYGIATNGSITIGQTGLVSGWRGIYLLDDHWNSTPNLLVNLGTITGQEYGVFTTGAGYETSSPTTITNTGTITADVGISGGKLTIFNSGIIKGTSGFAILTSNDGAPNKITNSGLIDGALGLGDGNDVYDGRGGRVTGAVSLGKGNDTFYGGAGEETIDAGEGYNLVDGGGGIDTLKVELDSWSGGSTIDLRITGQQRTSVRSWDIIQNVENLFGTVNGDAFTGNDSANVLNGDFGADTLIGGGGDDLLIGGGQNDVLAGGAGTDVTVYRGRFSDYTIAEGSNGSFVIIDNRAISFHDDRDTLTGIEYLQFADRTIALSPSNRAPTSLDLSSRLVDGDDPVGTLVATLSGVDPDGDALGYSLVSNPGNHFRIHGNKLLVDRAFTDRDADITITVRASDPHGASIDRTFVIEVDPDVISIPSGEFPEIVDEPAIAPTPAASLALKGGRKADVLKGGTGDDLLNGGLGMDKLTGGGGADAFAFSTKLGSTNVDRILDFNHADDTISLSKAVFGKLRKGVLSKDAFWTGTKAHDESDRIIYNEKTGALSYDADGSGKKYAAIKFAQVKAGALLAADDFFVV